MDDATSPAQHATRRASGRGRAGARSIAVALVVVLGAGCSDRVAKENDRLRARVADLEREVARTAGERDGLRVKLAELSRGAPAALGDEALDALPRCTSLHIGWLSGLTPTDRAAPATGVVVYLEPRDGRGRFVQAVGTLRVEVVALAGSLGDESHNGARVIASATLTPLMVREAYRSGVLGTHYEVAMELASPVERARGEPMLVIRASYEDAATGLAHQAERLIKRPG